MQKTQRLTGIKRVCIIGAGPAGVAAAKHLLAEKHFDTIDIYDQRSDIGGVWCYEPDNDRLAKCPVPHTDPEVPLETPRWLGKPRRATYQSPMYARLEANLPKMLMQHSDLDFPSETQLFPKRAEILKYLDQYADDVKHLIQSDKQVHLVEKVKESHPKWTVGTTDLRHGRRENATYDAVVAACGHYTVPFIPSYTGIEEFGKRNVGVISHSKWFDDPTDYKAKKVLVIGLGPSGQDIAAQISQYCEQPLLVSTRIPPANLPPRARSLPGIVEFVPERRAVRFADETVVEHLDTIMFCTGYLYSYPFFPESIRRSLIYPPDDAKDKSYPGERCRNVYQHLFYTEDPTMAFLTLPWNIVPFPVAEVQGAVVARVWSGRLDLPNESRMRQWEEDTEAEKGSGKGFHKLAPPSDVEYINLLHDWACEADSIAAQNGLGHKQPGRSASELGKPPPHWDPWRRWMRMNVPHFKRAFAEKGDDRHHIRTLEELGFEYPGERS